VFSRKWTFRIRHILDAIERTTQYVEGMDFETFQKDIRTQDAVVYNLAIIGEAVRHVPEEVQGAHPGIPWNACGPCAMWLFMNMSGSISP